MKTLKVTLKECAEEMMIYNDELNLKETEDCLAILEKEMEVNYLNDEQRNMFIEKSQVVYDFYIEEGFFTQKELAEIRKAVE